MMKESLEEKIRRVLADRVEIIPHDPRWGGFFEEEKRLLFVLFPDGLIRRVEHFGSTAVPGLAAKPIVDMLIEVSSLERVRKEVAPVLEGRGYDYFWRATHGETGPLFTRGLSNETSGESARITCTWWRRILNIGNGCFSGII